MRYKALVIMTNGDTFETTGATAKLSPSTMCMAVLQNLSQQFWIKYGGGKDEPLVENIMIDWEEEE